MHLNTPSKALICILDGWGEGQDENHNAVQQARTPNYDSLKSHSRSCLLKASGLAVGLPESQIGNSEVGHMNIGAGRIVEQILRKIDKSLLEKKIYPKEFISSLKKIKQKKTTLHIFGLISHGRVHGCQRHLLALAHKALSSGVQVRIHGIADGRDCPPRSLSGFLREVEAQIPRGVLSTLIGRYYALDRDHRWQRTREAWRLLQFGTGQLVTSPYESIEQYYAQGLGDEFLPAMRLDAGYQGFDAEDVLLCCNFRPDRIRQIVTALQSPTFDGFDREGRKSFCEVLSMVPYGISATQPLFMRDSLGDTLGEVISTAGKQQVRIAETEKFPHVTYFFNGGHEEPFLGEERVLVPSPRVASYDLAPEMSAAGVTDAVLQSLKKKPELIVVNYANPDMVGHTGDLQATIRAVETVDHELGRLIARALPCGYTLFVVSDHGNAESMWDQETAQPHTAHTTNPVRLIVAGENLGAQQLRDGVLGDIAPTVLHSLDLGIPEAMTGKVLLSEE